MGYVEFHFSCFSPSRWSYYNADLTGILAFEYTKIHEDRTVTYTKTSPKMVNARDLAGERRRKNKYTKVQSISISSPPTPPPSPSPTIPTPQKTPTSTRKNSITPKTVYQLLTFMYDYLSTCCCWEVCKDAMTGGRKAWGVREAAVGGVEVVC